MYPLHDIICSLLETPFNRRKNDDRQDVLMCGRPMDSLTISAKKEIKKSSKSYVIKFKKSWFTEFTWLCSSPILQRLFCWPCLLLSSKSSVWNKEGFADLLNITRSLHIHEDSGEHIKSLLRFKTIHKTRHTILDADKENDRLSIVHFNENVRLNKLFLQIVIDAVLYLSKQDLSSGDGDRSHVSMHENFKELLTLLISRSPLEVQHHYPKIRNVFVDNSKTIQNTLVECISKYINDFVKTEINDSNFFSIQVDNAYTKRSSRCSLIIRFVNSNGLLVERFLGFHNVSEDRTSDRFYNFLDNTLKEFNYEHKLIGQCYDGASVASRHLSLLQKRIKDKAPQAVFVQPLAQRLNLLLQQSFTHILQCRIFFITISGISTFLNNSPESTAASTAIETCSSISKLLRTIVSDLDKFKETLENKVNCERYDNESFQLCKGFLSDLNSFEFTFLAVAFNDIFSLTDNLFDILQTNSLDTVYCVEQVNRINNVLKNKRNDHYFRMLFRTAGKIARLHSSRKQNEIYPNYKVLFYQIFNHVVTELEFWFQDYKKLQFICLVDSSKFEQFNTCFPSNALENLQTCYGKIFTKIQRLKIELGILYADESYRKTQPEKLHQQLYDNKDIFTEAYKLFSLILTIVSLERSSYFERINTYARNTESHEELSYLANIFLQKELLVDIVQKQPFYEDITETFATLKDWKIDLMYKNK